MDERKKLFKTNLTYGVIAQAITFFVSCIVTFILPKVLGIIQFSYWQLFIFYTVYVCFFHFGIPDGIYLFYGGRSIDDLNIESISKQFRFMTAYQFVISIIIILLSGIVKDKDRTFIFICVAVYLVVVNFNNFYGMVFQAVNKAKWYSTSIMIDKVVFCIVTVILIINRIDVFYPYIIAFCCGRCFSCIYSIKKLPSLYFLKSTNNTWKKELIDNLKSGSKLMLSVISSTLVLGIARFIVDGHWGIETFGYLSFSLTISNFALQFINQIAIVLFPNLRMIKKDNIADSYVRIRGLVGIILDCAPFLYIPASWFVGIWLHQYETSIRYMAFLLPICVFDGKMQLLAVSFMKTLRKESALLLINICSLAYSGIVCWTGAYIFNNLSIVVFGMISAIVIRSLVSELYVTKVLGIKLLDDFLVEIGTMCIYWFLIYYNHFWAAFIIYLISYLIHTTFNIKKVRASKV